MNVEAMIEDAVERALQNFKWSLTLEVTRGNWTEPNTRTVVLRAGKEVLAQAEFDVVQKREYEG